VLRLRWSDPEPEDPSTPIDWRFATLTTATLFLNFPFWFVHGTDVWLFSPLPLYAALLGTSALLITALFFLGPALATQATRKPLLTVVEDSLGSIPAFGLRLCGIVFIVLWIASLIAVQRWLMWFILHREVSSTESGLIAAAILTFLFVTGLQSLRTSAKLALFTNKLGVAILIAALLRVRQGWPAILEAVSVSDEQPAILNLWHGLSLLSFYVAPLALLAANFVHRIPERKQVAMTAFAGIALPLAGTLLFVGIIALATFHSRFYTPSLNPNIAMALWGRAARSALPSVMMLATITMFGAVRFGARSLAEAVSIPAYGNRVRWVLLGCLICAIAWFSLYQDVPYVAKVFEMSATCLAVAGTVLTADILMGRHLAGRRQKIDGIGAVALLAGLTTPLYMPPLIGVAPESWWHPWLLPSCGIGFLVCLASRTIKKISTR
jgi:hypothetical protein